MRSVEADADAVEARPAVRAARAEAVRAARAAVRMEAVRAVGVRGEGGEVRTSSMKMIAGAFSLASSKTLRRPASDSPALPKAMLRRVSGETVCGVCSVQGEAHTCERQTRPA